MAAAIAFFVVSAAAAWMLAATPLATASAVVAAANLALGVTLVVQSRRGEPGRLLTGLHHVSGGLGGFFLFVAFALR